jgi:Spy/CpxP family protein refolding chaperone
MKKMLLGTFAVLLVGFTTPTMAQDQQDPQGGQDNQQDMSEMIQKRANRLAKDMKLDDNVKTKFVDLYTQYQNDLMGTMKQDRKQQKADQDESDKKDSELSDAEATQKVQESFQRTEQQIERMQKQLTVKKAYYDKFKSLLTPQQTMKVMVDQRGMRQRNNNNNNGNNRMGGMGGPGGGGFGGGMGGPGGGF